MRKPIKYRTQNDPEGDEIAGNAAATVNKPDKRWDIAVTNQQFTKGADLNEVMKNFGVTEGAIPPQAFPNGVPTVDLTHLAGMELRDAMDLIRNAEESFQQLPAQLRREFDNNPRAMWEFTNDPKNADKAVELGLLKRASTEPGTTGASGAAGTGSPGTSGGSGSSGT